MNHQLERFKIWDTLDQKILEGDFALTTIQFIASLKRIDEDNEGLYLHALGRRDRYVVIPEIPLQDAKGSSLWIGDVIAVNSLWYVVRFDIVKGVYCSLLDAIGTEISIQEVLREGAVKIGDIFTGVILNHGENHTAIAHISEPNRFL